LLSGDRVIAETTETMTRGQAERLMPMLEETLAAGGTGWRDLTALGVGVGPGNFTGIRIAVSAARGLALGLEIPAVGVSSCEARALAAPPETLVAVPAPREQVYLCDPTDPSALPRLMPMTEAIRTAHDLNRQVFSETEPRALARAIARIAAQRWNSATETPAPLYVRPADAAPSSDTPPRLLD